MDPYDLQDDVLPCDKHLFLPPVGNRLAKPRSSLCVWVSNMLISFSKVTNKPSKTKSLTLILSLHISLSPLDILCSLLVTLTNPSENENPCANLNNTPNPNLVGDINNNNNDPHQPNEEENATPDNL